MKYKIDTEIMINNNIWRIAEYRMRFGREWVYVLLREKIDGSYDSLSLDEHALDKIIVAEPQGENPNYKKLYLDKE